MKRYGLEPRVALLTGIAAWAVVASAGCGGEGAVSGGKPDVIIYLIDALRADHMGVYGYARDTTPNIDALAEDGVVFEEAYAPAPWTAPSVASLMTGLNPQRHGVQAPLHRLPAHLPVLGEYLQKIGYHTTAVVTNPFVSGSWGFARGFDSFYDLGATAERWQATRANRVNSIVFDHMQRSPQRPYFLYCHTIDPHGPNDPPPPYDTLFTDAPVPGVIAGGLTSATSPAALENMKALYDSEIYFNDLQFGKLIEKLRQEGSYDDALIIVLADHGEEHLDHGIGGHGRQLFNEVLRIPLVIKLPGNLHAGTRVRYRASLIDIVPTVLSALGVEPPPEIEGMDLTQVIGTGYSDTGERPLFFDLNRPHHDGVLHVARSVILGPHKYIEALLPHREIMLFDLEQDPGERNNLLDAQPERASELADMLQAYVASASEEAVPEDLRDRLRALGYLD